MKYFVQVFGLMLFAACGEATPAEEACARIEDCFGLIAFQDAGECGQATNEAIERSNFTPEMRDACEGYFGAIVAADSCSVIQALEAPPGCAFPEIP